MIYKDFQDLKLSALGFGAMRLPTVDGKDAEIDKQAASAMVSEAMKKGINYYDTAWGYHEGNSELSLEKFFQNIRETASTLRQSFPATTFLTWIKSKRFLRSSWKSAGLTISIFIYSTMCAR